MGHRSIVIYLFIHCLSVVDTFMTDFHRTYIKFSTIFQERTFLYTHPHIPTIFHSLVGKTISAFKQKNSERL